jgi:hypothetical protein
VERFSQMKILLILFSAAALILIAAMLVFVYVIQNVEQPAYRVVEQDGALELRVVQNGDEALDVGCTHNESGLISRPCVTDAFQFARHRLPAPRPAHRARARDLDRFADRLAPPRQRPG